MRLLHLPAVTPDAEKRLSSAGAPYLWRQIKADIDAGRSQLFVCPNDTYIVLAIEDDALIFVAAVGSDSIGMVHAALEIARAKGLHTIRFQTARPGMARLLKQFNPKPLQTIFGITVNEN